MRFLGWLMILLVPLFWAAGLTGCRNDDSSKQGGGPSSKEGKLYVANAGDGSLLAFDQAILAEGNLSPSRRFPESITGPTGIFLDRSTDTLYVANTDHNSILIYENASTLDLAAGSAEATRVISGPKTGLNHPAGVAYDAGRDRLYVANKDGHSVSIFQKDCPGANRLNGDISPCRTLSGAATLLNLPQALAVDTERDILYIADPGDSNSASDDSILVYENASESTVQGDLTPTRTITPHSDPARPESILNRPSGLFIDSVHDRLYVVNAGGGPPAVLVYENAAGQSGGAIPQQVLTGGSTQLSNPAGIVLSAEQDRLYLLDNDSNGGTRVIIFDNFSSRCATSSCNPSRVIAGPQTGLGDGAGIAYDPARDTVYVANRSANNLLIFALDGNLTPLKINTGAFQTTGLRLPNSFFYDAQRDRLYIANFSPLNGSPPIIVYENVSTKTFPTGTATGYDWAIRSQGNEIQGVRSIYVDRTRRSFIVLNASSAQILIYDLTALDSATKSGGAITSLPSPAGNLTGFTKGTAMAVDETNGLLYVAADCNAPSPSDCPNQQPNGNSIFIYNLNSLSDPPRVIGRGCSNRTAGICETFDNIKLNRPFGVHYDAVKDILYVTNIGTNGSTANTILAFHNPGSLGGTLAECDAAVASNSSAPSPCANISPNRIISSSTAFTDSERMQSPTAPYVNPVDDRLFLINWAKNSLFIFENASSRFGETRPDRIISGPTTQLAFSDTPPVTGALFVDTSQGREIVYVGQPRTAGCTFCLEGAFLVFGVEGDIPPGRTWSGRGAALTVPSALAVDTERDLLYAANRGAADRTTDDSLSILTQASEANGNLPMTGTLSVTNNSAGVTGNGTLFTTEFSAGDSIKIGTGTYQIASIASDTALTLATPYRGDTDPALPASLRPRSLCSPSSSTCAAPDTKLNNPSGLFVDPAENHLYVSNTGSDPNCSSTAMPCNAILVFHAAGSLRNNAVADLVLTSTALNAPHGLALDSERNRLYVANNGGHSVLAFEEVKGRTGSVTATPDAEIAGGATEINAPVGVAVDSGRDILYVLNQGTPEILVFEQASTRNGDSPPTRVISGSALQTPSALFLDPENDLLYVADKGADAIYIFTGASEAQGEAAHKTLSGDNTALNQPTALFVDTTR